MISLRRTLLTGKARARLRIPGDVLGNQVGFLNRECQGAGRHRPPVLREFIQSRRIFGGCAQGCEVILPGNIEPQAGIRKVSQIVQGRGG